MLSNLEAKKKEKNTIDKNKHDDTVLMDLSKAFGI